MAACSMLAGPKIRQSISWRLAAAEPMNRNFDFATHAVGRKHEVNRASKFIGYQITNYAGSVSRARVGPELPGGTLPPLHAKPGIRLSGLALAPTDGDIGRRNGKRAKFRGIGCELMNFPCNSLACIGTQDIVGPV